jgi:hypothetical protein
LPSTLGDEGMYWSRPGVSLWANAVGAATASSAATAASARGTAIG